jgi:hypothetical protein
MEDRTETLSIKEHVFRDADDSVLSIIPSRQSSRVSLHTLIRDRDEASIRSSASSRFRYSRLSFENQLFTSFVYKRNYQFTHRNERPQLLNAIPEPTMLVSRSITGIKPPEWNLAKQPVVKELNESPTTMGSSLILSLRDGIDIVEDKIGFSERQLAEFVTQGDFNNASKCLLDNADIIYLFHSLANVNSDAIFAYLPRLWKYGMRLFVTTMQRVAYTVGTAFIRRLTNYLRYNDPICMAYGTAWVWKAIDKAAAIADVVKSLVPGRRRFSVLQLACAGGNHEVASYLLRAGFSGGPYEKALSRLKEDHQMEKLLRSHSLSDRDIFTDALWQVLADAYSGSIVWWTADGMPLIWTADAAIELFVRHGADLCGDGKHERRTHSPLFDVFHAIDNGDVDPTTGLQLFEALLHNGADPDAFGVWKLKDTGQEVTISPLTLTAILGTEQLGGALLRCGAKVFGSGSVDVLKKSGPITDKRALKRIHEMIAAYKNDELASTLWAAEILRKMENQIDADIRHSARTSTRQYRQSQHSIQQISSTASSLDQANIQLAHEAIAGVVAIPSVHVSVWLNEETKATAYSEGAHILLDNILDNDFSSAIKCLRKEVDLGLAFDQPPLIATLDFILHVCIVDKDLATTVCKRLAFATGDAWTRGLKCFLLQRRSDIISSTDRRPTLSKQDLKDLRLLVLWRDVEKAAMFADKLRSYRHLSDITVDSLYFAIAANDYRVAEYLLSIGMRPLRDSPELLLSAAYNHAVFMIKLLVSHIEFTSETYTRVLETLVHKDDQHSSRLQTYNLITRTTNPKAALEIMRILLDRGADLARIMTERKDLLHFIIASSLDENIQLKVLKLLIQHGADVNAVAEIESTRLTILRPYSSQIPNPSVRLSTLALAAVQGLEKIVPLLLDEGARTLSFSIPNGRGLSLYKGQDLERRRPAMQHILTLLSFHRSDLHDVHDFLQIYEKAVWFMGQERSSTRHEKYYISLPIGRAHNTSEVGPEKIVSDSDEL